MVCGQWHVQSGRRRQLLMRTASLVWRSPRSLRLAIWFLFWLAVFSLLTRFSSVSGGMKLLSPRPRRPHSHPAIPPVTAALILDRLLSLDLWFIRPLCWKRAILLHRHLALEGVRTRIVFGVNRAGESILSGHAWLELDGHPFLEKSPPDYRVSFVFLE